MIRALTFLVKAGILVAAAVWLADQKGSAEIDWGDYTIVFPHVGIFLMTMLAAILLSIFMYRTIQTFAYLPRSWRRYSETKRKKKGYRALTLGLAAVAAGDKKSASYQSYRTRKLLPDEDALPLLLQAQAQRLQGHEKEAQETFTALTQNKDAAFLGVRGLMLAAMEARDHEKALGFARQALSIHPRQPWILKLVYDLEIRQRHWDEAQAVLARAEKAGAISPHQAVSDRAALHLARGEEARAQGFQSKALQSFRQAYKIDPSFIPAALSLARMYKADGNNRKAIYVIETTWQKNPHPDLARLWEHLMPSSKRKNMARYAWAERLTKLNSGHPESHLFAARIAMEENLWGEAREHFRTAENIEPSARLYWLWANLEKRARSSSQIVQGLQERAGSFPPERCWVCRETGRIYEQWHPVAEPHGSFNTIEWDVPRGFTGGLLAEDAGVGDVLLEAPRHYSAGQG